jgi:hypothetical protein
MGNNLTEVILGSGNLYAAEYAGTIPTNTEIETDANLLGRIQGGASLEYKPSTKAIKDDSGAVSKEFITTEEGKLKSGVLTWCLETLKKLTAAGRYSEAVVSDVTVATLKIGGKLGRALTKYLIRFVHVKENGYKFRCTIVGTASSGFKLEFKPEDATVIDAEFSAVSHDNEGTLVILEEELGAALRELTVVSAAGTASGKTAVSVTPALADGCSYKYKTGASVTLPTYDQALITGWTAWDGSAEITATAGQTIVIAEVTTDGNKTRGLGSATIVTL